MFLKDNGHVCGCVGGWGVVSSRVATVRLNFNENHILAFHFNSDGW